ncbi:FMN-binding protein [Arthrobacter sp. YAF16]|uniref:FMN-binding protein n=1 Tax=Arthrobacter sp. YAF16 TaxID=3233076 RepID=UPI003F8E5921
MRIRAVVSATLASVGILVAGWQSGAHVANTASAVGTTAGTTGSGSSGSTGSSAPSSGATGTTGSSSSTGAAAKAGGTFTGDVVQTRFGPVQVQITVSGGTISDVTALQLTDDGGRSVQISNYAAPLLRAEVLQAQSANVQTISGATVTSDAYLTSLQAALDAAHV